jgi:NADPH:quinone reductase-like Zn-dependent oxidoreductase
MENKLIKTKPMLVGSALRDLVVRATILGGVVAAFPCAAAAGPMMKAIVVHQYGGPEVLKFEDVARPEPKDDEMLIKVAGAGVNSFDGVLRSGAYAKVFKMKLPWIPGYDIAGTVEKIGSKISKSKVGDPVFAHIFIPTGGGYAEYALAKQNQVAPKPATIGFVEAAGVPSVALTAWQSLVDKANLQSGQTVLIHGGSGGVGMFAVQIAKVRGAKVIATASTANQDFLKELGADVAIDYKTQKFEEIAKDVDVVLDSVGGDTLERSYPIVKKGGFLVSIVAALDHAKLEKHGIHGATVELQSNGDELAQIGKLIDEKRIRVVVSQTFPLADAAKAETEADKGHTRGKIVLKVAEEAR